MLIPLLQNSVLNKLLEFDRWLFFKINVDSSNSFFDAIMPVIRQSDTWLPLYFFLFLFMTMNYGWRSFPWMLALGITAGICDQVSSSFVKDFFGRTRPCRNEAIAHQLNFLVLYCPGSGSFTSSHATNHFGVAMFIYTALSAKLKTWTWLFFFWAAIICFAQVYVGVHYPFDVIGGGILGCGIGYLVASIYNKFPKLSLKYSV